jgi:preprotein translocase subunit SecF
MEIFRNTNFDFLGKKWPFIGLSLAVTLAGIVSLILNGGPHYGIDFKGGNEFSVRFAKRPNEETIRKALGSKIPGEISVVAVSGSEDVQINTELQEEKALALTRNSVNDVLASLAGGAAEGKLDFLASGRDAIAERLSIPLQRAGIAINQDDLLATAGRMVEFRDKGVGTGLLRDFNQLAGVQGVTPQMLEVLKQECALPGYQIRSSATVGPRIGETLRRQALLATLGALLGMLIYIALRFEWIYGVAAVLAVLHDTIITIGLFSLFKKPIDLTVVAALLTLVGYSMNDTIVTFDRIRENLKESKRMPLLELINLSINQTLSRTILTSGLTFLTAVALWIFGGPVLNGFSFALVVGIIVGTFSSVFIASPILVFWQNFMDSRRGGSGAGTSATPQRKAAVKA